MDYFINQLINLFIFLVWWRVNVFVVRIIFFAALSLLKWPALIIDPPRECFCLS